LAEGKKETVSPKRTNGYHQKKAGAGSASKCGYGTRYAKS